MDQIAVASIIEGSDYQFLHFRAMCQLEPVVTMLRTRNGVPTKQVARLRLFLEMLFADDSANAGRFGTKRRASGWARNRAELVEQDSNILVLLGLCLTQTEIADYGERRLAVLLNVARVLGGEACCQPVFEDRTVTSVCQGFQGKFKASAGPLPFRNSPAQPAVPSNRMDIHTVLLQHRSPPSSAPVVPDTHSHLSLTLPPIVLPPPSALSRGRTSTDVPAFGLMNEPAAHGERPNFQMTPSGLEKVYVVTCSKQHLLPFLPKPPTIAVFQDAGHDEYKHEMSHDRYGRYELCLSKNGVQRLEATPLDHDRFMIAAVSLEDAFCTGKARSLVFRNVGCTVIDEDVYIIWNNPRILLFLRQYGMFQGRTLLQLMSRM